MMGICVLYNVSMYSLLLLFDMHSWAVSHFQENQYRVKEGEEEAIGVNL